MDTTLFYQLLGTAQWQREKQRPWVILRTEDASQSVSPVTNTYANSLYLTPFNLASDFLNFFSPKRSVVLVANDGITFRWYSQIPLERKHEYKDDDTKFYIDMTTSKLYFCGIVDQQYVIHQFYCKSSPTVTANTSWVFPAGVQPILAFDVAQMYKNMFDYDIVNAEQGAMIERGAAALFKQMTEWDDSFQEQQLEGLDYPSDYNATGFRNKVVGDSQEI